MTKNDNETREEYLKRCAKLWKKIEEGLEGNNTIR